MGTQPRLVRKNRAIKAAVGLAVALLVLSCSGCKSQKGPNRLAVEDSTIATLEQPVSERAGQDVQRVPYPVQGQADPSQNWGDLYLPAGQHKAKSVPLVILVHGGAWHHSIGASSFSDYAQAISARGVAVYNVEYRRVGSGGGWPTTFTDVASALDYMPQLINEHAELSGKTEVVGHSAGAQLVTWAGSRGSAVEHPLGAHPKFRPDRIVSMSGPLDMTFASTRSGDDMHNALGGTPLEAPARYSDVDPIQNIDPSIPVAAVHGTADCVVSWRNSQRYIQALQSVGGTGKLYLMQGDTHGSFLSRGATNYDAVLDVITSGV